MYDFLFQNPIIKAILKTKVKKISYYARSYVPFAIAL